MGRMGRMKWLWIGLMVVGVLAVVIGKWLACRPVETLPALSGEEFRGYVRDVGKSPGDYQAPGER